MFKPQPIGFVNSPYKQTSEIPKGLGAKHEAEGVLKVLPEFELGLTDIEGFSHLIVIWEFDRSKGFQLLGTPPSDNRPHGVFATRSPRRPNPIGLTVVELLRREGTFLYVRGVDMLDGTPILDIKPYLSNVPPDALRRGWLAEAEARKRDQSAADQASWLRKTWPKIFVARSFCGPQLSRLIPNADCRMI
jgi:tRNA-Thr(GGU) m(6)t(6)A37 methyltransferase TsaA